MKKIIVMLSVALSAVASFAATVNWNSGSAANGFGDINGDSLANSTAYAVTVYFYSDAAGANLAYTGNATAANATGAYVVSWTTADKSTTYYTKAIITGPAGTLESGLVEFTTKASGVTTVNFTTGAGTKAGTAVWGTGDWQAAPEPTSAMLLLMGLAGLALKRKRV